MSTMDKARNASIRAHNDMIHRSIALIAVDIRRTWTKMSPHAKPYYEAMLSLHEIGDMYGADPASDILARFLSNATGWRGPDAKRIKAELKAILKSA